MIEIDVYDASGVGDPPIVDPKIREVDSGDIVSWIMLAGDAHNVDGGGHVATTLRITFTGSNPTTGALVYSAAISAVPTATTVITVNLRDPLSVGDYVYIIEILDETGSLLHLVDPILRKTSGLPGVSTLSLIATALALFAVAAALSRRRRTHC